MSHALRIARHQQLVLCGHGLPGGDDGAEGGCRFPGMTGPTPGPSSPTSAKPLWVCQKNPCPPHE
jgi:hypothetical protein